MVGVRVQVKALAPTFFPNVTPAAIVCVTTRVPVRPMVRDQVEGPTDRNVRVGMKLEKLKRNSVLVRGHPG